MQDLSIIFMSHVAGFIHNLYRLSIALRMLGQREKVLTGDINYVTGDINPATHCNCYLKKILIYE
jgi:hypothetical protein